MNELCHRCGGTGNDPEHSGPCGECWAVNSTQREYDVVGDGFYAELCRLFDEHATRLHKVPGTFTHQLALVAADFTRKHIHTVATPSDEVNRQAKQMLKMIEDCVKGMAQPLPLNATATSLSVYAHQALTAIATLRQHFTTDVEGENKDSVR